MGDPTKVQLAMLALLALGFAASAQQHTRHHLSLRQIQHQALQRAGRCFRGERPGSVGPCSECVLRYYVDARLTYELAWLQHEVLSGVLETCGKTVQLRPREDFLRAHECPAGGAVLAAMFGMTGEEIVYVKGQPANVTQHFVLLHLSDEQVTHDTSAYPHFRAVLRNYWRADTGNSFEYLRPNAPPPGVRGATAGAGRVFWMPLGYGPNLLTHPALGTPLSSREFLFSWIGSTGGADSKPEREQMLAVLRGENGTAVRHRGHLETFANFNEGGHLTASFGFYSLHMYNTRVMPCPAGNSPEQFRIWEALEVGAVPVIATTDMAKNHLHPLFELDIPFETISNWTELPSVLMRLGDPAHVAELDKRSAKIRMRWADVKARLRAHAAGLLCDAPHAARD